MSLKMAEQIKESRQKEKEGEMAFAWFMLHGFKWEKVVDMDTEMMLGAAKKGNKFYHKDPASVMVPVLLTGSKDDPSIPGIEALYEELKSKSKKYSSFLFGKGGHMTMLTDCYNFSRAVIGYFFKKTD